MTDNPRLTRAGIRAEGLPQKGLPAAVNEWRQRNAGLLRPGIRQLLLERASHHVFGGRLPVAGALYLRKGHAVRDGHGGYVLDPAGNVMLEEPLDLGLAALRLVTTTGVGFLVDAWQNIVELENMKFHGFGTGVGAEATGDTALGTEETTQYNPDNTRPTGTTVEGASANIFRTVGTYTPDSGGTRAITEHGVLSSATVGAGVLWDRSVFAAVNLIAANGDSLEATYEATFPAGG